MKILVACEESQRVCIAFRNKGHDAYSCDLQDCSGGHPEWHIKTDVLRLIDGDCFFTTCDGMVYYVNRWDMIIAFPPCTYFSKASACRLFHKQADGSTIIDEERYKKGEVMKRLFLSILNADCDRIAIENPTPMKIWQLPEPTQVIQPYYFGEPYTKRTLLWLKGLPKLYPTKWVDPQWQWVNATKQSNVRLKQIATSSKERSKTFQGVADAMAEQWGGEL